LHQQQYFIAHRIITVYITRLLKLAQIIKEQNTMYRFIKNLSHLLTFILTLGSTTAFSVTLQWELQKNTWQAEDEKAYSDLVVFVANAVSNGECKNLNDCLSLNGNPYKGVEDLSVNFSANAGELHYVLRAYIAIKRGLPFTFVDRVEPVSQSSTQAIYSSHGNRVTQRNTSLIQDTTVEMHPFFSNLIRTVSTAQLRINWNENEDLYSDFYSPRINRDTLTPGTIFYDPHGTAYLVYEILENGHTMKALAGHSARILSVSNIEPIHINYYRPHSKELGAGFKKFRPFEVLDGEVFFKSDTEIEDFSFEQYELNLDVMIEKLSR